MFRLVVVILCVGLASAERLSTAARHRCQTDPTAPGSESLAQEDSHSSHAHTEIASGEATTGASAEPVPGAAGAIAGARRNRQKTPQQVAMEEAKADLRRAMIAQEKEFFTNFPAATMDEREDIASDTEKCRGSGASVKCLKNGGSTIDNQAVRLQCGLSLEAHFFRTPAPSFKYMQSLAAQIPAFAWKECCGGMAQWKAYQTGSDYEDYMYMSCIGRGAGEPCRHRSVWQKLSGHSTCGDDVSCTGKDDSSPTGWVCQ